MLKILTVMSERKLYLVQGNLGSADLHISQAPEHAPTEVDHKIGVIKERFQA